MDTESIGLLVVVAPAVIGLLIVAYAWFRIATARADFSRALRGWIIVVMTLALALFWALDLISWADLTYLDDAKPTMDIAFVIFTSWLAVCMAGLGTMFKGLNHMNEFWAWFRKHPLNPISAWGLLGIALSVLTAAIAYMYGSRENMMIWYLLPAGTYLLVSTIIIGVFYLRRPAGRGVRSATGTAAPNMMLLAASWVLVPAVVLLLALPGELESFLGDYNPYSWTLVVLLGIIARSISKTRFVAMVIDADAESVRREGFREYDIPRGAYLIHDEKSDAAFSLFSDLTTLPLRPDAIIPGGDKSATDTLRYLIPQGLIVTREFPDKVRLKHNVQTTPIIWLTETPGERRIAPTSLSILTDTIVRFMETNPNSIILLEGIEYICTFNEFRKVLRFLDALNEEAWITKARLILTVHPKAFDSKDLALLERDRNVVRGAAGVEDLKIESRMPVASA